MRTSRTWHRAAVVAAMVATSAWAQERPTVIDFPLVVRAALTPEQRAELQAEFRQTVASRKGVLVPAGTGWMMANNGLARDDCERDDGCLQRYASLGGCGYALFAVVESNARRTELKVTGRVVGPAGVAAQGVVKMRFRRATNALPKAVRVALTQLLDTLALEKLPPTVSVVAAVAAPVEVPAMDPSALLPYPGESPVENKPLSSPPPPPRFDAPVVTERPQRPGSGLRGLGIATTGVAAAAGGVALAFGISAMQDQRKLPADGRFVDDTQAADQRAIDLKASVALGVGIGAVALAITGGILLVASLPPRTPVVAIVPSKDGAALAVAGRF